MGAKARKENNDRSRTIFNAAQDQYNKAQNPTDLENSLSGYKPYTDEQKASMNYTPEQEQLLRSRAASPILSAYGHNAQEMQRRAVASGGAPNLIASLAKNGRNLTQSLSDSLTGVNAGIESDKLNRTTDINKDEADKKLSAMGLLGTLQSSRLGRGIGALGTAGSAPPIQGFPWKSLLNPLASIGSAFIPGMSGLSSLKPGFNIPGSSPQTEGMMWG